MLTDFFRFGTPIEIVGNFNDMELWIKRDDKIPFSFGTKVRKYYGLRNFLSEAGCRNVVVSGNIHSNYTAVFSYLLELDGFDVTILALDRDSTKVTANSILVESTSGTLIKFFSKNELENRLNEYEQDKKYVVIPPYGIHESSLYGLHTLWDEIKGNDFNAVILDVGSGMTFLSAYHYFAKQQMPFKLHGVAVGAGNIKLYRELMLYAEKFNLSVKSPNLTSSLIDPVFGKYSLELSNWIHGFYKKYDVLAEPVYSGKTLYSLVAMAEKGEMHGKVLYIHQGGHLNFLELAED